MNVEIKNKLIKRQTELAQDIEAWKRIQTDFNNRGDVFYRLCELNIHLLDNEQEVLRYFIEMGCCNDRE